MDTFSIARSVTPCHAKYAVRQLTKRCPTGIVEKPVGVFSAAYVDLNARQMQLALVAFRSPLPEAAILAHEVCGG